VANGTIDLGSAAVPAVLIYTGAGETTDRVINLAGTTGGATLDQSGTGTLTFSSALTATGAGSKTLTLQGSTTGSGVISGAIVNNAAGNTTALTKNGTGTWTLGGVNTYTGATLAAAGVLLVDGSTIAGSAVSVTAGTLGGTGTVNGAISGNGGTLSPGDPDTNPGTLRPPTSRFRSPPR